MTTDAPAAPAPPAQPSIAQQAIEAASAEMKARESTAAEGGGTGAQAPAAAPDATKPASAAAPAAKPDAASDEPDWTNPESRQAYLDRIKADHDADVERRLSDQKRTFKNDLDLATATKRRTELLAELATLRRTNPDAYAERISTDREAIAAIAAQMDEIPEEAQHRFIVQAMSTYADQAFQVDPTLQDLASKPDSDEWRAASDPETGGLFGYIQRQALERGKLEGVEAFKKSKEYTDAIEAARRGGAHDVAGTTTPNGPSIDDTTGGAGEGAADYGDDLGRAAVAAAQSGRRGPVLDMSRIRDPRKTRAH